MAVMIPHYLYFLVILPLLVTAQTQGNFTLGSSLTAGHDSSSWVSPSGDFAFGFQQIEAGGFLLAIWFNKIQEKTVVWSANGGQLAQSGSRIELTADGRFVLNDPSGQQMWIANLAGTGLAYAAMLDSGNLVLATNTSTILWQSFDWPTDTLLPTQQLLSQGDNLFARDSETNYSGGRYQLAMQADGNLVLYTINLPQSSVNYAYWASNTVGSGYQLVFNQSGMVYLIAKNGTILDQIFPGETSTSTDAIYQRAILEYDGVFRQYIYPKPSSSSVKRWPMAWSVMYPILPENICTTLTEEYGSGVCGFNSYCQIGEDQRPKCLCPNGYTWVDPNNEMNGCMPTFVAQTCDEKSGDFDLIQVVNLNWPNSDYEHYSEVPEDWCREDCLSDCFCAVAIFNSGDCWKKKIPLTNGRFDSSVGGKALIKVRTNNSTLQQLNGEVKKRDQTTLILIESVSLGSLVLFNILLLVAFIIVFRQNKRKNRATSQYQVLPGTNTRSFNYNELEKATDSFNEKVGQGAFATVFKGTLDYENTSVVVAVKKMHDMVNDSEKEFQVEISAIARTNHRNLVQLIGFCNDGQHRLLVYEFMCNGSLSDILFADQRPSWFTRMHIAVGTARGLHYLHEECSTQIIHCDIKPQNVLLDDSFTARICDFGLAKRLKINQTRTTTGIRGTKGYIAPEWFRSMPITVKVDVYSYGILLLELICCRKCLELEAEDDNQMVLADWAYDCYKEGKLDLLLQNDDAAKSDIKRVERLVMIAIWCIQEDPSLRPSMKKVLQMLEGCIQVSVPPDPSSYISSIQSL
ncbi:hypothetical protein Nepgr_020185 [Nepenthes gracilis]|uniref:Receptor-like serine/threonine-protein kinase n=1 Tax=Nepenthes gracilis TaxID=150966 RepID=A0AAD3XVT5_NEPGR|nr:hypothetical protein Nepgr_020185 [Nepenthes gracilis]